MPLLHKSQYKQNPIPVYEHTEENDDGPPIHPNDLPKNTKYKWCSDYGGKDLEVQKPMKKYTKKPKGHKGVAYHYASNPFDG